MPGSKSKSSQQSSILNFLKKDNKPAASSRKPSSPKFISKHGKKPVAAITPIQLNRDAEIERIDLTSSPDLLNDQEDDVFNELSTPVLPHVDNKNKDTKSEAADEGSWLTQIFGKTPQFDSSTSSIDDSPGTRPILGGRFSSRNANRHNNETSNSPVSRPVTLVSGINQFKKPTAGPNKTTERDNVVASSSSTTRNLKFNETKSPWDDDDDDFQVETTAKKSNHKPKQLTMGPSSPILENTEDLVADFGLDDSPVLDTEEIEDFEQQSDFEESEPPAFLEENVADESAEIDCSAFSPPHTPPPERLLETCPPPNFGLASKDPPTPGTGVPESQVIFDPSPEKPPTFRRFSSAGRSRLSTNRKISPGALRTKPISLVDEPTALLKTDKSNSSLPQDEQNASTKSLNENIILLTTVISTLNELTHKITRTASFNKSSNKMNQSDIEKHREWISKFESEFTNFFMEMNFSQPLHSSETELISKIESAKSCFRKLASRLEEHKAMTNSEDKSSNPVQTSSGDKVSNRVRPHFPIWDEPPGSPDFDESPPFEFNEEDNVSPANNKGYSYEDTISDSEPPSSPILTSRMRSSQASIGKSGSGPVSKFRFKKPGAGAVPSSSEKSPNNNSGLSDDYNSYDQVEFSVPSSPPLRGSNIQHNQHNEDQPVSSHYFNNLRTTAKETGTQFIEDFHTQHVGAMDTPIEILDDDEEISYDKMLYNTPKHSTVSKNAKDKANEDGRFIGEARNDGKDKHLSSENHHFSQGIRKVLAEKFGMRNFRVNQLQAVNSAIMGHDTFVLMPTGGGKSLCYQLPAAFQGGITVVVSPLVSLIQDQVTKLNGMNISADHLSGDDYARQSRIYTQMRGRVPGPTLLYVTPEKLTSSNQLQDALMSVYNQDMLKRFVIDEAHCVSQWGHDFRPDYKRLSLLRSKFPGVPMMALTATATPRVRTDILFQLKMNNPKWFLSSFNRANLKYEVRQKKGKNCIAEIAELILASFKRKSGIVYCFSQKDCETAAAYLVKAGISAAPYHAGLGIEVRNRTQDDWVQDKIRVVCATIAFGMGIDKPDVRYVIHQGLPKSIEGYYQESGRAGRDGDPSRCILFYNFSDMLRMRKLIEGNKDCNRETQKIHMDNLWQMVRYAENISDCRRVLQLQYFGEVFDHNRCGEIANMRCDNCTRNINSSMEKIDISEIGKQVVLAVQRLSNRSQFRNITLNQFVDVWRGMKNQKTVSCGWDSDPIYGKGKMYNALEANRILKLMVIEGFLWESLTITKDQMAIGYLVAGQKAQSLISGQAVLLHLTEAGSKAGKADEANKDGAKETDPRLSQLQEDCFNELKILVLETARTLLPGKVIKGVNEIIPLQALKQISEKLPTTMEMLGKLEYMTAYRLSLYGEVILGICSEYSDQRMEYLASQAQAFQMRREEDEFVMGGEDGYSGPSGSMGGGRGGRSGGKGRYGKQFSRGKRSKGYKRKNSGGQGGSASKRGRGSRTISSRGSTGSTSSSTRGRGGSTSYGGGGGGSSGSMGLPKRFGVNA